LLIPQKAENRSLYTKLLLGIVLCTVVTLTLTSTILLVFFNRIALRQVYQSDLGNLTQTSQEVISMTESAQALSFQIYNSLNVSKLMFYADPSIYDIVAAMGELQNYLLTMPFIESIYVYNPNSAYFYIASNKGQNGMLDKSKLVDNDILRLLDHYQDYVPFTPIPRTMLVDPENKEREAVYTYLCYDAIGAPKVVRSAVIVNIRAQWINKDIGNHEDGRSGKSFIIDNRGRLLSGDELVPGTDQADGKSIIDPIVADAGSGYFVGKLDSVKSLISYTAPDTLGWRYVRITPYREITRQVNDIRLTTIWIALAIFAGGLLLSWLLSRKLYVPIDRMANRMELLEVEKRNSLYTIRQDFLRNLVFGREPLNPKTLRSRLAALGISFDFQSDYRLALLKIDRFQAFSETRGSDLRVYKYAMLNIGSELSSQAYQVETIDLEADTALLILGAPASAKPVDEAYLQSLFRQIQKAVQEHLKIGVSIAYSGVHNQVIQLHSLYKQVCEASQYRLLLGHGCLINAEEMQSPKMKEYVFPVDKEKKLVDALMVGKTDEAKSVYVSILDDASDYAIPVVRSVVSHLMMRLMNVIHTLEKNHSVTFEHVPDWTMRTGETLETLAEVNGIMYALFDEIKEKLAEKKSLRHDDLIKRINDVIAKNYSNPNLSLNWIADELDLSPSYIGRIYKQITLKPLVEAINDVRMERSVELLQKTHDSIAEVAERVGFTNASYFYRMFKRHFGLTPTDFRKSGRDEESVHTV